MNRLELFILEDKTRMNMIKRWINEQDVDIAEATEKPSTHFSECYYNRK